MPKGFYYLIAAQFASGLADNALLILGIYFLNEQGHPFWWAPLLKFSLTLSYVVLASVVGPLSDAFPKNLLMMAMNALKIMGVVLLLIGAQPLCAFALIGFAASIYAPSKYGLATESVPTKWLVRANAWLEVSVVLAVILGIALGGTLTGFLNSPSFVNFAHLTQDALPFVIQSATLPGMFVVILVYLLGAAFNLGLAPMRGHGVRMPLTLRCIHWRTFWASNLKLWRDPLGGISLYVTTLYWGAGAVMQFAVLVWAQQSLGLSLKYGAYLQALVALGVIAGAFLAGKRFKLHSARQVLPWGLLLVLLLPLTVLIKEVWMAVPLLLGIGLAGGMLLVPMNALLQHRGQQVLSSGRSIAVQGFNENLCVLAMLAAYSVMLSLNVPLVLVMFFLAVVLLLGMLPLCALLWRKKLDG